MKVIYKPRIVDSIIKEIWKAKEENMQVEKIVLTNKEWEQLSLEVSPALTYPAKTEHLLSCTLYGVVVEREAPSKTKVVVAPTWQVARDAFKSRLYRALEVERADYTSSIIFYKDGDKELFVTIPSIQTTRGYEVDEVFFLEGVRDDEKELVKRVCKATHYIDFMESKLS